MRKNDKVRMLVWVAGLFPAARLAEHTGRIRYHCDWALNVVP